MTVDRRVSFLQSLNTIILTIISIGLIILLMMVNTVRENQEQTAMEQGKMKVQQDINVININKHDDRIGALEQQKQNEMKAWVESNFIRKR